MNKLSGFIAALAVGATGTSCMPAMQPHGELSADEKALDNLLRERTKTQAHIAELHEGLDVGTKRQEAGFKRPEELKEKSVDSLIELFHSELALFVDLCGVKAVKRLGKQKGKCNLSSWKERMNQEFIDNGPVADRSAEIWSQVNATIHKVQYPHKLMPADINVRASALASLFVAEGKVDNIDDWIDHHRCQLILGGVSEGDAQKIFARLAMLLEAQSYMDRYYKKSLPDKSFPRKPDVGRPEFM